MLGGDFRQVGGDFLAKALEPEGPPPAQETLGGGDQSRGIENTERITLHGRIKVASLIIISENTTRPYFKLVNTKKLT